MKWFLACSAVCVVIAIANTDVLAQRRAVHAEELSEAGQNGWRLSLDEARAEARMRGMPLMVVLRCVP